MTIRRRIVERLRHDALLVGGLALALLVLFVEPLQRLFVIVRDVEQSTGTALLPSLVVLLAALMLHQQQKRHAAMLDGQAVAATLHAADERARDLERLVTFGHATADALDFYALRDATQAHLVSVSGGRDAWVLLRTVSGTWQELAQASATGRRYATADLVGVADEALAGAGGPVGPGEEPDRSATGGHVCFPMVVAGHAVGVLGVWTDGQALSGGGTQRLKAAAALLAIGAKNVDLVREIREHSLRDALTGCCNRAHAIETLQVELRRADRAGRRLSVIMLDLDHFKDINDRHGHLTGDAVLAHVGHVLRQSLRASDVKARYGGEEFLIVLPETTLPPARVVAESLRRTLEQARVAVGGITLTVTASLGVTESAAGELEAKAVIARADAALYAAKREGRNCVRIIDAPVFCRGSGSAGAPDLAQGRTHAPLRVSGAKVVTGAP